MRESERWRKLAEAVHNGEGFISASIELVNNEEFERAPLGGRKGNALIYGKEAQKADVLYALLLAEEAEDEEVSEESIRCSRCGGQYANCACSLAIQDAIREMDEEMVNRLKEPVDGQALRLSVWNTFTGGATYTGATHPALYTIPLPASFAWADPEPFPEEKDELRPAYIPGYMERRTTWAEKWTAFRESVREWVRRTF